MIGALFDEPKSSIPAVLLGLLNEVEAAIVNMINIVVSIAVFATRSLMSLLHCGYVNNDSSVLNGKEIGGRNQETTLNMLAAFAIANNSNAVHNLDMNIFQDTTNLSM